ncbi:hypothetical protein Tco_1386080 [Tanacetum coccineum]
MKVSAYFLMLELHDATVSIEDANLKFLRSLPSVWHVVATMIRGQPGLDELDFDDLYNNLKVYEHELKDEIICSFFAQYKHLLTTTHDDEDFAEIDEDLLWKKVDNYDWQWL